MTPQAGSHDPHPTTLHGAIPADAVRRTPLRVDFTRADLRFTPIPRTRAA